MALQIVSGFVVPRTEIGFAEIDFTRPRVSGDIMDWGLQIEKALKFRAQPHSIVSATHLTLSTKNNTFYFLDQRANLDLLRIDWRVDAAFLRLRFDFLVIGEQ